MGLIKLQFFPDKVGVEGSLWDGSIAGAGWPAASPANWPCTWVHAYIGLNHASAFGMVPLQALHCPKTHEKCPSSFGNPEVISSDGRKLLLKNFFSKLLGNFS
jgi:hypothetical protein